MAITLLYQSMAYNSILFISIFYFNRSKIAMKLGKLQNRVNLLLILRLPVLSMQSIKDVTNTLERIWGVSEINTFMTSLNAFFCALVKSVNLIPDQAKLEQNVYELKERLVSFNTPVSQFYLVLTCC